MYARTGGLSVGLTFSQNWTWKKTPPTCLKNKFNNFYCILFNSTLHLYNYPVPRSPFSCTLCPKSFARSDQLKTHSRIHTGEKPFSCTLCPKSFAHSATMKAHSRIHTGEKPFSWTLCPKSFARPGQLKADSRIHTGEKPFSCSSCEKSFGDSSALRRYSRIHNRENSTALLSAQDP